MLEQTAVKNSIFFLRMNEPVHASNTKSTARHTRPAASRYHQDFKKAWHTLQVDTSLMTHI